MPKQQRRLRGKVSVTETRFHGQGAAMGGLGSCALGLRLECP